MAIRKRKTTWWIDFVSPSGERVRRSTETQDKALAQELHDRLKAEVWRMAVSRPKCNTRVIELKRELDASRPAFERRPAAA